MVRISDVIAYVGRDIEDAIKLKLIDRRDIPRPITLVIGDTNRDIINTLILDLVNNSFDKDSLCFSENIFEALEQLKEWNNENIYSNPRKMAQDEKIKNMFNCVLDANLTALNNNDDSFEIVKWVDKETNHFYRDNTPLARIVADYVSGMTDDYLMNSYKDLVIPKSFGMGF